MSATVHGTDGLVFGLTTETGGYINSLEVRSSTEKTEVRNEQGQYVGVALYNPTVEITGEAVLYGDTGLGAIAPAATLTLANYSPTAGIILVEEVTTKSTETTFQSTSFKAFCYPLITT